MLNLLRRAFGQRPSKVSWVAPLLQYLAVRSDEDLQQALLLAPEAVTNFIERYMSADRRGMERLCEPLATSLGGTTPEALAIRLLRVGFDAQLIETWRTFPPDSQFTARQAGMRACQEALELARELGSLPCIASHLFLLATAFNQSGSKPTAREKYEEALATYRELAHSKPDTYRSYLATTLNNLGALLVDLNENWAALEKLEEMLTICRDLGRSNPDFYRPPIAETLNSLGNLLCSLNDKEAAREKFEEALAIYRDLARARPVAYRATVATTLRQMAAVLRNLNEKRSACERLEEALAIYREMPSSGPGQYLPEMAPTLNNLGILLGELNKKRAARETHEEALEMYCELARVEPGVYQAEVATALHNLGLLLQELNEPRAARARYEKAVEIRRELARSQPGVYGPRLADTLNNFGTVLVDLNERGAAFKAHREALEIYRELARSEPGAYKPAVAGALNNLGATLYGLNEKQAAREKYEEALASYREIAGSERDVYQPRVAGILNNLGSVLSNLNEKQAARETYDEAAEIYSALGASLDSARLLANVAAFEASEGGEFCERALELSRRAIGQLEGLLSELNSAEHAERHAFKREIETAYHRLIRFHASSELGAEISELPPLLEAVRRSELLYAGNPASVATGAMWEDVFSAKGSLVKWMREQGNKNKGGNKGLGAAFVWTQVAGNEMIFAILRPGRGLQAGKGDQGCLAAFRLLRDESGKCFEDPSTVKNARTEMDALATQCVNVLPREIRDLLFGDEYGTIILAPCGESSLYPWETLHLAGDYFALRKVVTRTHGLGELEQLYQRQPKALSAVVVGNPRHQGSGALPAAGTEASALCARLKAAGWKTRSCIRLPNGSISGVAGTTQTVVDWLREDDMGLVVFSSHGAPMSILMEGKDELTDATLLSVGLRGSPLVHFDCCFAGINVGTGGGRYLGMPVAALHAGASAVVASAHPLYDEEAAHFAEVLYTNLLSGLCLGDALLEARKALKENPLHWATTVLWGNPFVYLRL